MNKVGKGFALILIATAAILCLSPTMTKTISAQTSSAVWSHVYGNSANGQVFAENIIQTRDGGYAILADSGQIGQYYGCELIKLDSQGNIQWNRTFTADHSIDPTAFIQTSDSGFAMVGISSYFPVNNYTRLVWFTKTDANGTVQWTKYYGDELGVYEPRALAGTSDGGYIIAGDYSSNTTTTGWEALAIKIDASGNEQWIKTYAGQNDLRFFAVVQSTDGGYAMAGIEGDSNGNIPHFWLVKTDSSGNIQWNQTYARARLSGDDFDTCNSMIQTSDGGYALAGWTAGGYARDYTEYGSFWLVKTDSKGNMEWNSVIGCWSQGAVQVIQTFDGGYALSGIADSGTYLSPGNQFELAKTDSSGNLQWTYSGFDGVRVVVCQSSDGAYVLAGGGSNLFASKITVNGNAISPTSNPNSSPSATNIPTATPITATQPPVSSSPSDVSVQPMLQLITAITLIIIAFLIVAIIILQVHGRKPRALQKAKC